MSNDREYIIKLLDTYGSLLTKHQKEIMDEYYNEDLSMIEISENYDVTKAAISDIINRCVKLLKNYETKLKVLEKDEMTNRIIEEMREKNIDILNEFADKLELLEKEK